jgi:hypothetical protein
MPASLTKALVDRIRLGLFGIEQLWPHVSQCLSKPAPIPERLPKGCIATNRRRAKQRHLSSTRSGIAPFEMKQPKRQLNEQYQLAGEPVVIAPISGQIPC